MNDKIKAIRTDLDRVEAGLVDAFTLEDDKVANEIQANFIKCVFNREQGEITFFNHNAAARDYFINKINGLNITGLKARGPRVLATNLRVDFPAAMAGRPEVYLVSALRRVAGITEKVE